MAKCCVLLASLPLLGWAVLAGCVTTPLTSSNVEVVAPTPTASAVPASSTPTIQPTSTATAVPSMTPTATPTATSTYRATLSDEQRALFDAAPSRDDVGWSKTFLPDPFETVLGYGLEGEVVAIYDPEGDAVRPAYLLGQDLFVNASDSGTPASIGLNPKRSEESARGALVTTLQWFRIEWCAAGRGTTLSKNMAEVVASDKGQALLDGCTVGLNAWTFRDWGVLKEPCRPFNYSIPHQWITLRRETGIVWQFYTHDDLAMTQCGVRWTDDPRSGGVPRSTYLGYAFGFEQRDDELVWISLDKGWKMDAQYSDYELMDMLGYGMLVGFLRTFQADPIWSGGGRSDYEEAVFRSVPLGQLNRDTIQPALIFIR